jgi:hypothetical protein
LSVSCCGHGSSGRGAAHARGIARLASTTESKYIGTLSHSSTRVLSRIVAGSLGTANLRNGCWDGRSRRIGHLRFGGTPRETDSKSYPPLLLLDAFSTVFVTRNTLVHSPALLLHFDKILAKICHAVFTRKDHASKLVMEFLTNFLVVMTTDSPSRTTPHECCV